MGLKRNSSGELGFLLTSDFGNKECSDNRFWGCRCTKPIQVPMKIHENPRGPHGFVHHVTKVLSKFHWTSMWPNYHSQKSYTIAIVRLYWPSVTIFYHSPFLSSVFGSCIINHQLGYFIYGSVPIAIINHQPWTSIDSLY